MTLENDSRVVELDTAKGRSADGNRETPLDSIQSLMENIEQEGQLHPGIVHNDPTLVKDYVVADGNRRFLCCRILGIPFKAIFLDHVPEEDELIRIRVASNAQRLNACDYDIARDAIRYMEVTGKNQAQTARDFGISESRLSKILAKFNNAVEEVRMAEIDGRIGQDVGRIIASLPVEHQSAFLEKVLAGDFTRDAIEGMAARLKQQLSGSKAKCKPVKMKTPGGIRIEIPGGMNPDALKSEMNQLMKEWRDRFNPG